MAITPFQVLWLYSHDSIASSLVCYSTCITWRRG